MNIHYEYPMNIQLANMHGRYSVLIAETVPSFNFICHYLKQIE